MVTWHLISFFRESSAHSTVLDTLGWFDGLPGVGKQDYKKTKPILRATKLKAEAKKTAIGIKEVGLVLAAILALLLAFYAFFYLRLTTDVDPDLEPDED